MTEQEMSMQNYAHTFQDGEWERGGREGGTGLNIIFEVINFCQTKNQNDSSVVRNDHGNC